MQNVLNLLETIVSESYTSAQLDQDGLSDRVFDTCSLFFYKVKLYNMTNKEQVQRLYNDLRLSKFVEGAVITEPSYPLLWLTEIAQKLLLRLDSFDDFKDLDIDEKVSYIVSKLVPVLIYHSKSSSLIDDPVFQTTLNHDTWVELLTNNSWLLVGCMIRFLPVTIFNEMVIDAAEDDEE